MESNTEIIAVGPSAVIESEEKPWFNEEENDALLPPELKAKTPTPPASPVTAQPATTTAQQPTPTATPQMSSQGVANAQPTTTAEPDDQPVDDERAIELLVSRFAHITDPEQRAREIAKAYVNLQRVENKHRNEVGELRKLKNEVTALPAVQPQAPAAGTAADPAPQGATAAPQAVAPAAPATAQLAPDPAKLDDEELNPDNFYNPNTDRHNEDGWPIDPESGQPYRPIDAFGCAYTPDARWDTILEKLDAGEAIPGVAEAGRYQGKPAAALNLVNRLKAAEAQENEAKVQESFKARRGEQAQYLLADIDGLKSGVLSRFPQPVAEELAKHYASETVRIANEMMQSGKVDEFTYMRRDFLKEVFDRVWAKVSRDGSVERDASTIMQNFTTVAPPQTARAAGVSPVAPVHGRNGMATGAAPQGVSSDAPLVKTGLMSREEAAKYTDKDFKFD